MSSHVVIFFLHGWNRLRWFDIRLIPLRCWRWLSCGQAVDWVSILSISSAVVSKHVVSKSLACPGGTTGVLNQESENRKMKKMSGRSGRKYLNSHEWFAALPAKTKTLISFHLLNQIKCANTDWKALWKSFPTSYRTPKSDVRIESYKKNTEQRYSLNADEEEMPK